tara:strand:- start:14481 stop:14990 length:510 start_codon:yes stop_codon:yes gene_type:complete
MDRTYYDAMNRPRTESLFLETFKNQLKGDYEPVYTMRPYDHKGCRSACQIYMNADSEYDAAMQIVNDMRHWRKLCGLRWFMKGSDDGSFDGLEQWRKDKAAKDATEAVRHLKDKAADGNVTAQKTLLDYFSGKSGAGRPKKETENTVQQEREAKILDIHKQIKAKQKQD